MTILDTLELLKRPQFYSGCNEIKIVWEGNTFAIWFEWHTPAWGYYVSFTEEELLRQIKFKLNIETAIMDRVNHFKDTGED